MNVVLQKDFQPVPAMSKILHRKLSYHWPELFDTWACQVSLRLREHSLTPDNMTQTWFILGRWVSKSSFKMSKDRESILSVSTLFKALPASLFLLVSILNFFYFNPLLLAFFRGDMQTNLLIFFLWESYTSLNWRHFSSSLPSLDKPASFSSLFSHSVGHAF